jgi:hypothetical protein
MCAPSRRRARPTQQSTSDSARPSRTSGTSTRSCPSPAPRRRGSSARSPTSRPRTRGSAPGSGPMPQAQPREPPSSTSRATGPRTARATTSSSPTSSPRPCWTLGLRQSRSTPSYVSEPHIYKQHPPPLAFLSLRLIRASVLQALRVTVGVAVDFVVAREARSRGHPSRGVGLGSSRNGRQDSAVRLRRDSDQR